VFRDGSRIKSGMTVKGFSRYGLDQVRDDREEIFKVRPESRQGWQNKGFSRSDSIRGPIKFFKA
jgi:hypothetical protein